MTLKSRNLTKAFKAPLLTAALAFASVSWLGCGGDSGTNSGGGGGGGGGGGTNNGGKVTFVDPSTVVKGTFTDSRNSQTYKTVKIGTQTWMSENLNYKTTDSWCYDDDPAKCAMYGRLYTWSAAKTACPSGWHLPSKGEWQDLAKATGTTVASGGTDAKLKSKSGWGWNILDNVSGNGTDDYGFSALPGGSGGDGYFRDAGEGGVWWTATDLSGDNAYNLMMSESAMSVLVTFGGKSAGYSVRCLKN